MLDVHTTNLLERLVIAMEEQTKTLKSIDKNLENIELVLENMG